MELGNSISENMTSIILAAILLVAIIILVVMFITDQRTKKQAKTIEDIDAKMDTMAINMEGYFGEEEVDEAYDNINKFFADTMVLDAAGAAIGAPRAEVEVYEQPQEIGENVAQERGEKLINMGKSGKVYSKDELFTQIKD